MRRARRRIARSAVGQELRLAGVVAVADDDHRRCANARGAAHARRLKSCRHSPMRVPPAHPAASRCSRSCERHGSGSRSASADAGDARVKDEAVHVRELGAQRPRKPQVEEAVQAHRAADVEQQDDARAHAAAVLPGQPERRAAAARRCGVSCPAGRGGGRGASAPRGATAGASAAARSGASAPRCRAPGRRDRGRGNRSTRATLRGSRHACRLRRRRRSRRRRWPRLRDRHSRVCVARRAGIRPALRLRARDLSANAFLFGGRK